MMVFVGRGLVITDVISASSRRNESHDYILCGLDWEAIHYTELGLGQGNVCGKG